MKKVKWFTNNREWGFWWRVGLALAGFADSLISLFTLPFGFDCNVEWEFVKYMYRKDDEMNGDIIDRW